MVVSKNGGFTLQIAIQQGQIWRYLFSDTPICYSITILLSIYSICAVYPIYSIYCICRGYHFVYKSRCPGTPTVDIFRQIGVAITQGIMVPRFCRYNSGFRSIDYKSEVRSGKKTLQKNVQIRNCLPTKDHGFLAYFFFHVFFLFDQALNFHNTFVGHC